jgi:3-methyladenine DNA glycosylase/8-oxoguanine DNA glycosylase
MQMHWILSTTNEFSLRQTIRQSSWILHAPFRATHTGDQLLRIERIAREKIVAVVIAQNNQNLVIHTSSNLSGQEIEELTKRARRMLRLGEDFKPFYNILRIHPLSGPQTQINATFLRGATLFEDVIRASSLIWQPEGGVISDNFTWLVDHFGDPLPSNPTLHAFPSPRQILQGKQAVAQFLDPILGNDILHVANVFAFQTKIISDILAKRAPSSKLSEKLKHLLQLNEITLSHVMLSLGRYDFIPTDVVAQDRWFRYWEEETKSPPLNLVEFFERWQPWGGLAYWLWSYSPVFTQTRLYRS